jgi:predicted MFS family arabinose efflux permease
VLLFGWGFAAWSLQVPLQYQLTTTVPRHAATAVALLASAVYLGAAIGAAGNGILLTATSTTVLPIAAGALALLALALNHLTGRHSPAASHVRTPDHAGQGAAGTQCATQPACEP